MKHYEVYGIYGNILGIIKAGSQNAAEKKAKAKYGERFGGVAYTEI